MKNSSASYNPSSWNQRVLVAILAFIATLLATYMGLYEWKLIPSVWDPVFGDGTQKVLDSHVSHGITNWVLLPDAIFGALAYFSDIVFALAGSVQRWKDRPWLVILFGIDVIPIGCVSLILVALQGLAVGHWCFPCMITASISTILVFLAYGEVDAGIRFLHEIWKRSKDWKMVWNALWGTDTPFSKEAADIIIQRKSRYVAKNM